MLVHHFYGLLTDVSRISAFVGKMDTLRWSLHMEESLAVLEREQEHVTDEVLVNLIKTQLVAEEAQKLLVKDVMGESVQAPTYVFKKGLLSRIGEIRGGLTVNLADNRELQNNGQWLDAKFL